MYYILQKCNQYVICGTQFKQKPADIYCISSKGILSNAPQMYVVSFCKESLIHIPYVLLIFSLPLFLYITSVFAKKVRFIYMMDCLYLAYIYFYTYISYASF